MKHVIGILSIVLSLTLLVYVAFFLPGNGKYVCGAMEYDANIYKCNGYKIIALKEMDTKRQTLTVSDVKQHMNGIPEQYRRDIVLIDMIVSDNVIAVENNDKIILSSNCNESNIDIELQRLLCYN